MSDEFETMRQRIEAYPTMLDYCLSRDDSGLELLISHDMHRRNIFGSYPGTLQDHARDIIKAIRQKSAGKGFAVITERYDGID